MKITREQLKHIVRETMIEENEYQTFFKKALEKTGKSIPQMSDEEKKTFFNKIDAAWNGKGEKNEDLVGGQKKLDIDGDGKIDASDLAALRAGKKKTERFGRGVKGPTFGSANESVNENVALNRLNSVQATREKMISYISHKMANGLRKPDSWYDKKEKTLSNKSYKDLEKIYLKLGGVKESVNEANNDEKYVVILFHDKGGGFVMTRPLHKREAEEKSKLGYIVPSYAMRTIKAVEVSDARKIRGLVGKEYLK